MTDINFDGQVAIVTGAGGNPGLGRSFAQLLAARGARVVVNDLGVGPDGRGIARADAERVAQEIRDAGGEAVADLHSVAEEDAAKAVVQTALDTWGRVDILVNNAGVAALADFDEISARDIERVIGVHLLGNIWMSRAAWPHFTRQGYGRIVAINSGAMFGAARKVVIYGAAKGGIFGLTRGLALEGYEHGIRVNTVGPAAGTIAHQHLQHESDALAFTMASLKPEQVAPAVAFLAHRDCPCTGRYFEAAGGYVSERVFGQTTGWGDPDLTLEQVRDHWSEIVDTDGLQFTPEPTPESVSAAAGFVPKPYQPDRAADGSELGVPVN